MEGLGQYDAAFASPDFMSAGAVAASELTGIEEDSPYVNGPAVGGFNNSGEPESGAVHVNTGASSGSPAGRGQNWSNLFDWKHGPLFWALLIVIIYFGLFTVGFNVRLGK